MFVRIKEEGGAFVDAPPPFVYDVFRESSSGCLENAADVEAAELQVFASALGK
jgi:hypothetical protein